MKRALFTMLLSISLCLWCATDSARSQGGPGLTTIEIRDQVAVSGVKRFGIVLGWRNSWGAGQIIKNVIENPGFEAGLYGSVVHAEQGATGNRIPQAFWDTRWNNDTWGIGQPPGFWDGAGYEIIFGPAKGRTGTVTSFAHENDRYVFHLDSTGAAPDAYDTFIVRLGLPGVPGASGYAFSEDTTTVRPGSPGSQSLHLTYPAESWQPAYAFYMDSWWRDGDRRAGKLLLVRGNWRLEFWAKGKSDGDQVRALFHREGEANFIDRTFTLTTSWQRFEENVFIPDGMDPVRSYTPAEYHPILGFEFHVPNQGDEIWVDDQALYRSDDANPTVFTDRFVNRLKELSPSILRDWDNHQFGNTLDNMLAVPFGRKATGYRPDQRFAGGYGYSLHEFLDLCVEVGAEPWCIIPPSFSPAELTGLVEYLAGTADGSTPYADRRAALGQGGPWTAVFPAIHLEFGNELWGWANPSDPYFGASLMNGTRLGRIAHDRFAIIKSSPYYDPANFDLIIGGQAGFPGRQQEIEQNSSNHDTIALAPYFQGAPDQYASDDEIFYPVFAQPFDNVTNGIMRQSKDYIDAVGQGTGLAIYELNFHTTGGPYPIDVRNDLVTGMAGISLPLHMLVYLRDLGIRDHAPYGAHGFSTNFAMASGEFVRLFGMLRDLEATGRKRPNWLSVELVNKAVMGDMLATVQGGANPSWHQMPYNGVLNEIDVTYVQSFAFRSGTSFGVVLFNLSLTDSQQVRLDLTSAPGSNATRYDLASASIHDDNENGQNVAIQTTQLTNFADPYQLTLPPHSVTALRWSAQGAPGTPTATSTAQPTHTPGGPSQTPTPTGTPPLVPTPTTTGIPATTLTPTITATPAATFTPTAPSPEGRQLAIMKEEFAGDNNLYYYNNLAGGDWTFWDGLARNPSALARDLWAIPSGNDILGMATVQGANRDELHVLKRERRGDVNLYCYNTPAAGDWTFWDGLARNPLPLARDLWVIPSGNSALGIAAVDDMNGDGREEMALLKRERSRDLNLYYYNAILPGDRTFWDAIARNPSPLARDLWVIPFGNDAVCMTAVDVDGGGRVLAVVKRRGTNDLDLYIYNSPVAGDWTFRDAIARNPSPLARDLWAIPSGRDAVGLAAVDANSDGQDELAVLKKQRGIDLNLYYYNAPAPGDRTYWDAAARNPSPLARDLWVIPRGNAAVSITAIRTD